MPDWVWRSFSELTADELYDIFVLRQTVFVVEQNCAYLDADGWDRKSRHLYARDASGLMVAYLRLLEPGVKYAEPSIGRVVSHPDVRGTGAGTALMEEAIRRVEAAGWGPEIRIAAQMYLERFYEKYGFRRVSDPYLEDDIWHVDMRRG